MSGCRTYMYIANYVIERDRQADAMLDRPSRHELLAVVMRERFNRAATSKPHNAEKLAHGPRDFARSGFCKQL
jgi:hypothetical protein